MVPVQEHEVAISIDPNGNFTFSPSRLKVQRGDAVHWVSDNGPFTVEFLTDSPAGRMGASGHIHHTAGWFSETLEIRGDAGGRYQYAVAVSAQPRRRVLRPHRARRRMPRDGG